MKNFRRILSLATTLVMLISMVAVRQQKQLMRYWYLPTLKKPKMAFRDSMQAVIQLCWVALTVYIRTTATEIHTVYFQELGMLLIVAEEIK